MKKVLFTATVDSHILQFHIPYLKMFKEKGYEVHVATNGTEKIPYCDIKHTISFERSPFKINNLKAIKQLKKIIDKENFDIIHCHTPMGSVVTRLAAKKARKNGTRVIYTAHGFHFFKGAPLLNWIIYYPIEKFLSKITDTIITINLEDYNLAKNKFKKCKNIEYVPGVGINCNCFNNNLSVNEKKKIRASLNLKESDFILTCVARLDKNKNQGFLIDVMDKLKEYENIKLLFVGPDEYNEVYYKKVKELELDDKVLFLGMRKDVPKLLAITNIVVSASYREGLPVNVMEAMAAGLPVIGLNCRGIKDLITNGENGYIIEIDNNACDNFIKKILNLYNDSNLYKTISENNVKKVKQYDISNILDDMNKIYKKKKKIMHLLSSNSYSGAENVVCTIINTMKEFYDFIYCCPTGDIKNILAENNICYEPIDKLNKKGVRKAILKYHPDIIHAHDFKASFVASFFNNKATIISHIHKNDPQIRKVSIKSILFLIKSKRFKKIIGVSDSVIKEYVFRSSISKKYITLNNFVDKELIVKKSNEFKANKKYDLFYFGRLSEEKNPLEFIEIVREIKDINIKCVMIGDGPLKDECLYLINKYSLQKNIDMIGFKSNPFPYIKVSKIGVMPSKYEGFGLTAVESSFLNKPVFNSGVGGLKDIFTNDKELICNTRDEYVQKIKKCLKDSRRYSNLIVLDREDYIKILDCIYK